MNQDTPTIVSPSSLTPYLREVLQENQIVAWCTDSKAMRGVFRKVGFLFTPEGTIEGISAFLMVPARFSKKSQNDAAMMIRGFFHGVKVTTNRMAEAS